MGFIAFVRTAWSVVWSIYSFVKELDKQGVEHFSDEWWLELRHKITNGIVALTEGQDKGWRKLFKSDNQMLCGLKILFKSDTIGEAMGEKSLVDARKSLTDAIGIIGSVGGVTTGWISQVRQKIIDAGTVLDQKNLLPPAKE